LDPLSRAISRKTEKQAKPANVTKPERHVAAHPHPCVSKLHLVADALAGDFALELGEGEQHVERQPPHRGRRLCHVAK
jgi:hypothetical protein